MNEVYAVVEQARLYAIQNAPPSLPLDAVPVAIVCLIAGIGMSVLGAKFARAGLTMGWAVIGAVGGTYVARDTGMPVLLCLASGAVMLGIIGYQMFRLWVGMLAGGVLALVALGVFCHQRVMPHVPEFQRTHMSAVPMDHLPVAGEPSVQAGENRGEWLRDLWAFTTQQDASIASNGRAIGIAAAVVGLCIGVLAIRTALVFSTSVLGTGLVVTGMASLLSHVVPEASYRALQGHPNLITLAIGGFVVSSLAVQAMLTKSPPAVKPEVAKPARS